AEHEPALAADHTDVAHAHLPLRLPLGDLHLVGERERPDPRVALEPRAGAASLPGRHPDGDGVVHPVDVRRDVLDGPPDGFARRIDGDADADPTHALMLRGRVRGPGGARVEAVPLPCTFGPLRPTTTERRKRATRPRCSSSAVTREGPW